MSPSTGTEPPANFVYLFCVLSFAKFVLGSRGGAPAPAIVYPFQPTGTRRGKGRMSLRLRTHHVCLYLIRVHGQPHLTRKCLAGQPRTILKTENSVTGGETACGASTFLGETSSQAEAEAELGDHWPLLSPGRCSPRAETPLQGNPAGAKPPARPPSRALAERRARPSYASPSRPAPGFSEAGYRDAS